MSGERPPLPAWIGEVVKLALVLVSIVASYFGLKSDQRSTHEEVARLTKDLAAVTDTVNKMSDRLPNREADTLRFKQLEDKVNQNKADSDFEIAKLGKWKEDVTKDLIRKGIM